MMPTRISKSARGLTWLLVMAFLLAPLPMPVFAQEGEPELEPVAPPMEEGIPSPDGLPSGLEEGAPPSEPDAVEEPSPDAVAPGPTPAEAARSRIQQLRAERAAAVAATSGEPAAEEEGAGSFVEEVSTTEDGEQLYQFNLAKESSLDVLLEIYSRVSKRTMIKAPGINATFPNTKVEGKLTRDEIILVMDTLLSMNKIALVPLGTRFYRVVPMTAAPTEGLTIQKETPEGGHPESDVLVSQLIGLKYLELEDAKTIVETLIHGEFGKVQPFDRINSLLVTDTSTNLRRIYEILEMVDQPTKLDVMPFVIQIKHAKATEIASRLNELISDSQGEKKEEVAQVAQPAVPRRTPGMIRARQPAAAEAVAETAAAVEAAMAERGMIQGKVKIIADERTNILIILSKEANLKFIKQIIDALDVPVDPEVIVQVVALEFADAEEMEGLLNDFIGAAKSESETKAPATGDVAGGAADSRAQALEAFVQARAAAADRVRQAVGATAATKIGQLSPNTKILADKRTNTLMLMGTKGDIAALQEIIKKVDIMLAQVLIEAVILEVNLNNVTAYGVNWLQKSMTAYSQKTAGANGGVSVREPMASWGGAFGRNDFTEAAGDTISRAYNGGLGLNYFFTFAELNMDMVLSMVASSGEGRVLATPVILTTDNTEASIISGQSIPIRTGDTSEGGTVRSDYEFKDVGIELKVTPRINPSRYVTLEIVQTANTLGEPVDVGNDEQMTSINKREMQAMISVPSRSTIVLGGLVQTDYQGLNSRVPILGHIPLLGALFRSESKNRKRTELLVLITPYVLMTPDEARLETERLHHASNVAAEDWYRGWSDSSLAPFSPTKLREMNSGRRAQLKTDAKASPEPSAPPVALIEPSAPMPKPSPEAKDPEAFGREVERVMRGQAETSGPEGEGESTPSLAPAAPLPLPEGPMTTAPFVFDPSGSAPSVAPPEPAPPEPEKKPRRSLWGTKVKKEEPKPSMFPAPPPDAEENGEAP